MTRSPTPLLINDISQFARNLRDNWPTTEPSQTELLSLIAKATGYRNYQTLKADNPPAQSLDKLAQRRVSQALQAFDENACMVRWPQKTSVQRLCLTWFWSHLPARRELSESDVNEVLKARERFGDHVLLRRSLIDHKLAKRSTDGASYRRIEARPDAEQSAIIAELSQRQLIKRVDSGGP